MNKTMLIIINVITGLFVSVSIAVGYGISGMGEGSTPDARFWLWVLVWVVGLALQFKQKTRVIGLIISFIPVIFILYVYIAAYSM
ncbi:hypothetical protein M3181_18945 [Mesobacillus maritimus]|uniref:hypothetical protein n=1 Tax=Mesobacillus maritimus TaxID=1643336 RepID=UPI002040E1BD|nr:hypothetical protein [Mesobacillus maritimus]MCM3671044.1 hypothetical protein [Mesobacillus maritimus]